MGCLDVQGLAAIGDGRGGFVIEPVSVRALTDGRGAKGAQVLDGLRT